VDHCPRHANSYSNTQQSANVWLEFYVIHYRMMMPSQSHPACIKQPFTHALNILYSWELLDHYSIEPLFDSNDRVCPTERSSLSEERPGAVMRDITAPFSSSTGLMWWGTSLVGCSLHCVTFITRMDTDVLTPCAFPQQEGRDHQLRGHHSLTVSLG
jgi:hypothetical protein